MKEKAKQVQAAFKAAVLSHRFARYNKGIMVAIAAVISGASLYYGNDAVSTLADTLGVITVILTPNAQP